MRRPNLISMGWKNRSRKLVDLPCMLARFSIWLTVLSRPLKSREKRRSLMRISSTLSSLKMNHWKANCLMICPNLTPSSPVFVAERTTSLWRTTTTLATSTQVSSDSTPAKDVEQMSTTPAAWNAPSAAKVAEPQSTPLNERADAHKRVTWQKAYESFCNLKLVTFYVYN